MRLYLMQGIVAYHQNKRAQAKQLLDKAERELNNLKVLSKMSANFWTSIPFFYQKIEIGSTQSKKAVQEWFIGVPKEIIDHYVI